MRARALVVDDDRAVRFTLRGFLEDEGVEVEEATDGESALERLRQQTFDLVITDLRMPRLDGMELLRRAQGISPKPHIVLVTAHGSERHAVEAMKLGALDYFRKPFNEQEILGVVRRAIATIELKTENEQLRGEVNLLHSLVFVSRAMSDLAVLIQRVARRNVTVLITGETGTGKERVAEAVVRASARANARFVRFNCASLSADLAEAELFGHARGAFSGAVRARAGLFREADRGTLLLDEVGELSLDTQAKLLRVIQSGEIRPVGEDRTEHVDVRLIAATHRDLAAMAAGGRFREDLFYRLNVVTLHVPALRERPEDIPVLARHFLSQASARFALPPVEISAEIITRLTAYAWPGNVRELENSLERAAVMSADGTLDPTLLPDPAAPALLEPTPMKFKERVSAYERSLIAAALETAQGNQSEAARLLDLSRATLQDKLKRHGFGS